MTQTYVSVIGASRCGPALAARAEELGRLLARRGCIVVCGGRSGVMEAVARGATAEGGVSIGLLPEADRSRAAPHLTFSIPTAIGWARNLAVVASGDAVIAVGGAWGTLSEIALARTLGRSVVLLESWELRAPEQSGDDAERSGEGELDGVARASSPAEAVELALAGL